MSSALVHKVAKRVFDEMKCTESEREQNCRREISLRLGLYRAVENSYELFSKTPDEAALTRFSTYWIKALISP